MKKQLILILSVIFLIIPIKVEALTGVVSLSCDKTTLKGGESTNCRVNGNVKDDTLASIKLSLDAGPNLSISNIKLGSNWIGTAESDLDLYTGENIEGDFSIANFTVTAGNVEDASTTISVVNIIFGGDTSGRVSGTNKTLNISIHTPSSDTSVKTMTVDGKNIQQGGLYTTEASSVVIAATASSTGARVSGDIGTKSLSYGDNNFKIIVTAENGESKTYEFTVTRKDNRSDNAYLKSLSLSSGSISFNRASLNYNVKVATNIETVEITATADDSKANVEGTGLKKLKLGKNYFNVTVTAENGNTKTYKLTIEREDNRSTNNNLKELTISSGTLDFSSNKTDYEVVVDNEVEKVTFTAKAEDSKSTISGLEEKNLEVGSNVITINVKAENGVVKTYTIIVIRNKEVTETNENKAKNISIKNHDLFFKSDKTEYTLETRYSELDITVELNSENATYEITGNENLHDGSIIQITVTDAEGNNNIYTIKVKNPYENLVNEEKIESSLLKLPRYVYLIIIGVCVVIIVILLILVYQEKSNIHQMLKHHKHHKQEEPSINYNENLSSEPTYETLEMAKIDLEDYLNEEQKARRKKGTTETAEEINDIRSELEEKIAILEDAENTLEKLKKNNEKIEDDKSSPEIHDIEITSLIPVIGEKEIEEYEAAKESKESKPTRSKKTSKEVEENLVIKDFEATDDIDDLIHASNKKVSKKSSQNPEEKTKTTKKTEEKNSTKKNDNSKKSSTNKKTTSSKNEDKESSTKKETPSSEQPKTTSSKNKKKKKKSNSPKTETKSKDELLDEILSGKRTKKD